MLRREEGCTWVGGLDRMAVLYVRCCCRAEAVPAAYRGWAVLCAVRDVPQYEKKMPRKAILPNIITSEYNAVL